MATYDGKKIRTYISKGTFNTCINLNCNLMRSQQDIYFLTKIYAFEIYRNKWNNSILLILFLHINKQNNTQVMADIYKSIKWNYSFKIFYSTFYTIFHAYVWYMFQKKYNLYVKYKLHNIKHPPTITINRGGIHNRQIENKWRLI